LGWERDEVLKRGAGLQGLVDEGQVFGNGDDEVFGAWRGKGRFVFKEIYSIGKFFHLIKWTSDR
jgi:hypothetical protein